MGNPELPEGRKRTPVLEVPHCRTFEQVSVFPTGSVHIGNIAEWLRIKTDLDSNLVSISWLAVYPGTDDSPSLTLSCFICQMGKQYCPQRVVETK